LPLNHNSYKDVIMRSITVFGCGRVGSAIALDLARDHEVLAVDIDPTNFTRLENNPSIQTIKADLHQKENIRKYLPDSDLAINAVPGFMGFKTLKSIIETGKNVVDIAFFPEDPLQLDELAKASNSIAVTDCGVAPGISNLILGYHAEMMDIENFECLVGGLPVKRTWPFQYKAPFSPIDILEEYTRPARYKENNCIVTRPALSDPEYVDFPEIGTLESFNSDGLRTLLHTIDIPNMKEKTLRYPGHIEIMRILRETGFFSQNELKINDSLIKPLDLTSRLLFKSWKLEEDEEEFTVMKITIKGTQNKQKVTHIYDLLDRYDPETGISSMARTTGYACTAVASLILNGEFSRVGVNPPEYVGKYATCFKKVLEYMEDRNIVYKYNILRNEKK